MARKYVSAETARKRWGRRVVTELVARRLLVKASARPGFWLTASVVDIGIPKKRRRKNRRARRLAKLLPFPK